MAHARILVVDDDPKQLAALKRVLRRSQFVVDTATNGRKGLRMAVQNPPDLVLLDISMPCMSGHEFLRRFRRLESKGRLGDGNGSRVAVPQQIPVIFLTALNAPHQLVRGLDAGAIDYITKPFDPNELRARIRTQLRQVRQQKKIVASKETELMRLEFSIGAALEAATECQEQLNHLEACLDQAEYTDYTEQQQDLVMRVKEDIQNLTQSLSSIVECFAAKGIR